MPTKRYDELTVDELTGLVGRPVTVSAYDKGTDKLAMSITGTFLMSLDRRSEVKVEMTGVTATGDIQWATDAYYALITWLDNDDSNR